MALCAAISTPPTEKATSLWKGSSNMASISLAKEDGGTLDLGGTNADLTAFTFVFTAGEVAAAAKWDSASSMDWTSLAQILAMTTRSCTSWAPRTTESAPIWTRNLASDSASAEATALTRTARSALAALVTTAAERAAVFSLTSRSPTTSDTVPSDLGCMPSTAARSLGFSGKFRPSTCLSRSSLSFVDESMAGAATSGTFVHVGGGAQPFARVELSWVCVRWTAGGVRATLVGTKPDTVTKMAAANAQDRRPDILIRWTLLSSERWRPN
mmetsp:Transcript_10653/g.24832  ORF Transcript_10653/g.24832 Transcript_10653/m.24832 type:complete len:270 (+) Transcript_10653:725-1534(+)